MRTTLIAGMLTAFVSGSASAATLQGSFYGTFACSPAPTSGGKQFSTFLLNGNKVKLLETEWVGNRTWAVIQYFGTYNPQTRAINLPNYQILASGGSIITSAISGTLSADGNVVRYRWIGLSCNEFVGNRIKVK